MIESLKIWTVKIQAVAMAMVVQFDIMDSVLSDISIYAVDEQEVEQTLLLADDMGQSSVIDEAYYHGTSTVKSRIKNSYNNSSLQYIQEVYTLFSQYTQKETIITPGVLRALWIFYCVYRI